MLKKNWIKYFLLLAGLISNNISQAQNIYNLQLLIDRVLEENYEVRIQRNIELISDNNNTLGNAGFLPVVDAEGNASISFNNTNQEYASGQTSEGINAKSRNLNGLIVLNWTVFDGFKMFAKKQQLDIIQQLGAVNTRYFIEQTVADITVAYYQLLQEKALLQNYENTLNISRFRMELERKKIAVGAGNALLYNQALVDYNNDSLTVLEIENLIKSLEIQINQIANLSPDDPFFIENTEIKPVAIANKDSLVKKAMDYNQEIKQSMLQEIIAEKNVIIEKSDYYPVVNLFGQYSFVQQSNEVGFINQNKTYGPQFGISIRLNLFNGGNDRREVINEQINYDNSDLNYRNIKNQIHASVLERYYQYSSLTRQLQLSKENLLAANRSLEIAKVQFENGTINGYDFRQTQLSLIRANNTVIQLEFRLKNIEVQLNRLSGELLNAYL
jgi:outer membrane protein TolC